MFFSLLRFDFSVAFHLFGQHSLSRLPDQGGDAGYVFFMGFPDTLLHLFRGD